VICCQDLSEAWNCQLSKKPVGIEDLPELLKAAGFEEIKQLDDHFLAIGFVRATKPAV
jgi:hypothetical protein